jgi:hypothetical protein
MSMVRVLSNAKFVFVDGDGGVGVDLVALDNVLVRHFLAGLGIDIGVLDAMAGVLVDLVEGDLLALRRRRKEPDRTGHQGQAAESPSGSPSAPSLGIPLLPAGLNRSGGFRVPGSRTIGQSHSGQVSPTESKTCHTAAAPIVRRRTRQRFFAGEPQRLSPDMGIGPVLCPAVLVAFVNCADLSRKPIARRSIVLNPDAGLSSSSCTW